MKVFISWSGERSRKVAELLDDWLQCVIQAAEPWMSSKDIDRGALWFTEISDQLAGTGIGIVCLTKENKVKPWILFESGALAKGISSNRVCTLLIDLKPTDVENPLAQFNHTKPNRTGLWELVRTINVALKEESLKESILEKVFDTYWPQFEETFKLIIKETPEMEVEEVRSENDILIELLSSVRGMDRRMRMVENREIHNLNNRELDINRRRPRASEAEKMIIEMLDSNMSPEIVQEIMDDRRVPLTFIKETIENYLKNK
ncbi:toll/interleukin-1 receptor domain-containing protein [Flavobacterium acetivorans]|uniref:toll/interleukin-1 receptor domain-containing protein n=1 Tax=Flavobacterium acetivorans TaxID=2893883 RepID=UPI001E5967FE|nr:toll/interleukin-1 receptor domain-containing protein [Flavobacterium sp. F-29]UFH34928.1 toll/interleukin-1 receptor domain-containing protein [Flavobacterium sp. F-29]